MIDLVFYLIWETAFLTTKDSSDKLDSVIQMMLNIVDKKELNFPWLTYLIFSIVWE